MKVLKFGGTSVGSINGLKNIKSIVESSDSQCVVVVSAVGGVTDKLIKASKMATAGDVTYKTVVEEIRQAHYGLINELVPVAQREETLTYINTLIGELENIYVGLSLIKDISKKTESTIVSYGERMSSYFISKILNDCKLLDSRTFIKTENSNGRDIVRYPETNQLIEKTFNKDQKVYLVQGFISSDYQTGEATTLGRGGSDYTAAIIAASLNAEVLEIWTDVDGFMTADPRIISSAYVIPELTFIEAMELSNFGAKVLYPPTIYPVYHANIPIYIKNTFNPSAKGTFITREHLAGSKPIKGISSINDTCLITVEGLGMVGVSGIGGRLFKAIANEGISAFFLSQASSENTISIGVNESVSEKAVAAISAEFDYELKNGILNHVKSEHNLATVAIVGENMKRTPGISGKLFSTLGRNGISVIGIAQGASETNISFVVSQDNLKKTLNTLHESFFLSEYQELNIFQVGTGTVGGSLLEQICMQQEKLKEQNHVKINVVGIADIDKMIINKNGIDLSTYKEQIKNGTKATPELIKEAVLNLDMYNEVFVDCTASPQIATLYQDLLSHNVSVVAANKIAASSEYAKYENLKNTARQKGIKYLFETNVGAGLPVINTLNNLINSGDKVLKIEAVLSGTLNFIFNTISKDIPLSKAIVMAKEARFSEPDPRIDLCGKDVIRKLVILARESGYKVEQEDVVANLFVPDKFFEGTLDDFWKNIPQLDAEFEVKRQRLEKENKKYRFVATMENGACSVGLQEVGMQHPFYDLEGSNNIIMITTERYHEHPMIIKGYGAGASVTAAGVFGDIMSIANIR